MIVDVIVDVVVMVVVGDVNGDEDEDRGNHVTSPTMPTFVDHADHIRDDADPTRRGSSGASSPPT